ncbi:hypothetical protein GCM10027449_21470 [Sinomonas notoginsengisoli]|uniref:cupredoxin domain-containing protein n=1 Tax=Sinomonas notoginsengisoli TaxID=1457311 RepID=UPI001F16B503|nr:cupredoxin domain-containing protein [Sinomonas notoginsengisoli]
MPRPPAKALAAALLAASTALAAVACSAPSTSSPPASHSMEGMAAGMQMTAPGAAGTIHIKDFAFTGPAAVQAGASLNVMNMDGEAHSITADDGSFDVSVAAGQTAGFSVPAKPGVYQYHCKYHADMHGTLTVD